MQAISDSFLSLMDGCGVCRFDAHPEDMKHVSFEEGNGKNRTAGAAREAELLSPRSRIDSATPVPVLAKLSMPMIDHPLKLLRAEQENLDKSRAHFETLLDEKCKLHAHMKDHGWVVSRTDMEKVHDARRIESLKTQLDSTRIKIVAHEHAVKGYKVDKLKERTTCMASFGKGSPKTDTDTSTTLESPFPDINRRDAAPGSPVSQPVRPPPETAPLPSGKSAAPSTCLPR